MSGIRRTAMTLATIPVLDLVVPWVLPGTKARELPERPAAPRAAHDGAQQARASCYAALLMAKGIESCRA